MDRLTAAAVLLEAVGRGSISAAAAHLGMSRAMATRYVALAEQWAGARLLHRTTRKLSLTAAGEEMLPLCRQMLALEGNVSALAGQDGDAPSGLVRISAASIFAEYCLTDALMAFLRRYPAVTVDLQIADHANNLAGDGIDLALRVTKQLEPGVIARKLGEVRSVVCASPAYLRVHGTPTAAPDLTAHNCLMYNNYSRNTWHFQVQGRPVAVSVSGNFSTSEAAIVVRAAVNGHGITLLPHFAAASLIADGKLAHLLPEVEPDILGVYAIYLSRRHMPAAMRVLIDFLADHLRTHRQLNA
ncbi:LysR family transcriptional regulator [Duganella sp. FT27W]|uniref:LysR family transcriptional regulator n=1 Tax=Duganella sp. FT27W TaxID=2654636 RepID=UPI00128B5385|nr:LysR family transcriptional regulator [Duganella sp. FT27W]MPQ55716.1 LysR family transcriptional regulator [Duganella sp. FT27W]